MKIRYKQTESGLVAIANVYSQQEHGIDPEKIDGDAVHIIEKLTDAGFESFLVGGAVRDLLLGKIPKDFDVATEASPRQVHKIFRNSRIIGKRFKLVHIVFNEKIIEVSTFRSLKEHEDDSDNQFGTVEEDAKRRDFSINSFYFNPLDNTLVDFNNAMKDLKAHRISSLIPLKKTFVEDPVRMIRALKYSVTTGFKLRLGIRCAIRKNSTQLIRVSSSRLTEEVNKILAGGYSSQIIKKLYRYNLLVYLLPCISVYARQASLYSSLDELDKKVLNGKLNKKPVDESDMFLALTSPFIVVPAEKMSPYEVYRDIFRQIKVMLSPNTPPNYELEEAALKFMKQNKIALPKIAKKESKAKTKEHNRQGYSKRKTQV